MPSAHTTSPLFDEIASLFASAPMPEEILAFHPSKMASMRAVELLRLDREGLLDEQQRLELEQFEQAELLMRLVKARIRAARQEPAIE
jgi:hypothetical protein